jgi:hypothetical protein
MMGKIDVPWHGGRGGQGRDPWISADTNLLGNCHLISSRGYIDCLLKFRFGGQISRTAHFLRCQRKGASEAVRGQNMVGLSPHKYL